MWYTGETNCRVDILVQHCTYPPPLQPCGVGEDEHSSLLSWATGGAATETWLEGNPTQTRPLCHCTGMGGRGGGGGDRETGE